MAHSWNELTAGPATKEALTIPVDYASSVDPAVGVIFTKQQEVDDALGGAAGFKHLNKVFAALPRVDHAAVISLASGIHRPESGATMAWFFSGVVGSGSLTINGPTTHVPIVASTAIIGVQTGGKDPYIDCAAASFPNDGSLKGRHARLSTGQLTVIHDHTDARLYVIDELSPDPTGGSVEVTEPAAKLHNSPDDIATEAQSGCLIMQSRAVYYGALTTINDVLIDSFDANNADNFVLAGCNHNFNNCQLRIEGGNALQMFRGADCTFKFSSIVGDPPLSGTSATDRAGTISESALLLWSSYILGGEDGIIVETNGTLTLFNAVFDEVGAAATPAPALDIRKNGILELYDFGNAKSCEIRDTDVGIRISNARIDELFGTGIRFVNCSSNCLEFNSHAIYNSGASGISFVDGGGNLGLGIKISGVHNDVKLLVSTDVSGSSGDIEIESVIDTYANLVAVSPLFTAQFNKVEKA